MRSNPGRRAQLLSSAQAVSVYRSILQRDFVAFVHRALITLYPHERFHSNFHIEIIAAAIDDVLAGRCSRLLLCQPPRNLKSVIMSVCLPAFILGHFPMAQIIVASYSQEFAEKLSRDCRTLMESEFYQQMFATRLSAEKNTATEFETTAGGFRLATSITGTLTGRGADYIIVDDPLKAIEAHSQPARTAVNEWFDGPLLTRLTHKNRGVVIVTMQRLHEDDLAGHILEKGGWTYLCFPAIATERQEFRIDTPYGPKTFVRNVGDVLHPERESRETLEALQREMGDGPFEAQYQQSPVPRGGLMVKADWFIDYGEHIPLNAFDEIVFSCDTANKATELANYSVIIIAGIKDERLYMIDLVRERLAYPDLRQRLLDLARHYNPSTIIIEDHASGTPLIQDLKMEGLHQVCEFKPAGDKVIRLRTQSASIKSGLVLLPAKAPWRAAFIREACSFPNAKHDDQVDALTQLITWYRQDNSFRAITKFYGDQLSQAKRNDAPLDANGKPPTIAMRAPHNMVGTTTDLHRYVRFPAGGTAMFFEEEIQTLLKNGWTKTEHS